MPKSFAKVRIFLIPLSILFSNPKNLDFLSLRKKSLNYLGLIPHLFRSLKLFDCNQRFSLLRKERINAILPLLDITFIKPKDVSLIKNISSRGQPLKHTPYPDQRFGKKISHRNQITHTHLKSQMVDPYDGFFEGKSKPHLERLNGL